MSATTVPDKTMTAASAQEALVKRAFAAYMEQQARADKLKQPHRDKVRKARRAKNKAARASRRANR